MNSNRIGKRIRFSLVSDIHLTQLTPWRSLVNEHGDYLVLAGDIARIDSNGVLVAFLTELCEQSTFKKIVYVCGNHEYYSANGVPHVALLHSLRKQTAQFSNLVILDNEVIDLEDNLRLFGATLWSQVAFELSDTVSTLPIYDQYGGKINTNWFNMQHYKTLHILDRVVEEAHQHKKRLLVVTHYAPTFDRTLAVPHYTSDYRFMYCSNLDHYLTKKKIYVWMFGHTHVNVDYLTWGDARIVTNQAAVTTSDKPFDANKTVDLTDEYKSYDNLE